MRERRGASVLVLLGLVLCSCVVPARKGAEVTGRVLDRESGRPVEGAVVVVRWDGRYGDALPDRELLGHGEAVTGADGRFRVPSRTHGGLTVWPVYRTEVRVVGVMHEGYLCPSPRAVGNGPLILRLAPAADREERRDSCRPIRAGRGEAERYMAAWRGLFPAAETPEERDRRHELERLLAARRALGFGANCSGPVYDMALSPDGARVAWIRDGAEGREARVLELSKPGAPPETTAVADAPPRRLAWTGPQELVLWQPSSEERRVVSPSVFTTTPPEIVWRSALALPAALDRNADAPAHTSGHTPIDPTDLSDEAESRWHGRSFALEAVVDPVSGLAHDRLRVRRRDGSRVSLELPGETCDGSRFGRPHYRIDESGHHGLDLRFVDGGCRVLRIDLERASWSRLDDAPGTASCQARRRVPPGQLHAALRGWTRELRATLESAGADPDAAYSLVLGADGTRVLARDFAGRPVTLAAAPFPIETPLRRIDVSNVAPATRGIPEPAAVDPSLEELEPL